MKDLIDDSVFELFPTLVRGIVVAKAVHISIRNDRIAALLAGTIAERKACGPSILNSPSVTVWDEAHKHFGSNPTKYPPSIRSLLQRVVNGKVLPYINDAVALFNSVSLKYLLPCGGDNLDVIQGDLCLGLASGDESFVPLGGTDVEHPIPGEVVYYDTGDRKVMCRRWNWRNGHQSKISTETKTMLINIDGLGDSFKPIVKAATADIAEWLRIECGATVRNELLDSTHRSVDI